MPQVDVSWRLRPVDQHVESVHTRAADSIRVDCQLDAGHVVHARDLGVRGQLQDVQLGDQLVPLGDGQPDADAGA